jgi:hypothetical protein
LYAEEVAASVGGVRVRPLRAECRPRRVEEDELEAAAALLPQLADGERAGFCAISAGRLTVAQAAGRCAIGRLAANLCGVDAS